MINDGGNYEDKVSPLDDTGTRIQFLTELYELWSIGLSVVDIYDKRTAFYEERKRELESALKLLWYAMSKDYVEESYKRTINALPRHGEDTKDEVKRNEQ